jgi:hypothetical protein
MGWLIGCRREFMPGKSREERTRIKTQAVAAVVSSTAIIAAAMLLESPTLSHAQTKTRYMREYTASGELILPKDFHEWATSDRRSRPTRSMVARPTSRNSITSTSSPGDARASPSHH